MKKEKYLRFVAIFIAALIVSIPFYVSDVHAQSLSVVKNSGQADVQDPSGEGFIKTADDIWTLIVNAVIPGQSVSPSQLKVNGFPFNSCTPSVSGYDCTYQFDYRGAQSLVETVYAVNINLYDNTNSLVATKNTNVTADGTAPTITDLAIYQGAGPLANIEMTVQENPANCAGIARIEIYDAESNTLVRNLSRQDLPNLVRCGSNDISTTTTFPPSGNLTKTGKVVVYDRLGHSSMASDQFTYDYNGPSIIASSLILDNFGSYIPSGTRIIDVFLNVSEDGDHLTAEADSSTWGWVNEKATNCTKVDYVNDIFTCVWQNKNIPMSTSVSLTVTVSDGANTDTSPITKTFTLDSISPTINFFGAGFYDGVNYIGLQDNTIKVIFNEAESGINPVDIRADLSEIQDLQSVSETADRCEQQGPQWTCIWETDIGTSNNPAHAGTIYLVDAADIAGNDVSTNVPEATTRLVLDDVPPDIDENDIQVRAFGYGEPVDFFQSQDILEIVFFVNEEHGVTAQVDVNDIAADPANVPNDGILPATCTDQGNNIFRCSVTTPHIKPGHDSAAEIPITAYDVAGNRDEEIHEIEILGVDSDLIAPAFWSISSITRTPADGVDISAIPFMPQRVYYQLSITGSGATLLGSALNSCTGDTAQLNDWFMINNMYGSTSPYLVLEVKPHTPDRELTINCTLDIFSRRGNEIISVPEKENISAVIPFYQTQYDTQQSNLDEKIEDARKAAESDLYKTLAALKDIVVTLKYGCIANNIIDKLRLIFYIWQTILGANAETNPYTAAGVKTFCKTVKNGMDEAEGEILGTLSKLCKVVTCRLGIINALQSAFLKEGEELKSDYDVDKWWNDYVTQPAETNYRAAGTTSSDSIAKFKEEAGLSQDPYSNIVMALVHLCIPAIIYNLEKLRQIECRYVGCLENDVKDGVATVEACKDLKRYQTCKYWIGGVFSLIPYVSIIDGLISKLKSLITDPVGALEFILVYACNQLCEVSSVWTVVCSVVVTLTTILDIANDIVAMTEQYKTLGANYCAEVDVGGGFW